jgi:membrane protein DedA with SNARE-associated domain
MTENTDSSWLGALLDWSVSLMDIIGPAGAGIAIGLENLFPPLPSEVVLPMAGLAASRGSFSLFEALAWTTAGSVVGAFLLYGIGVWFGADRLRRIADKVPLMRADDIDRTVAWFERHGGKAVFFGRMIPIFRSLISIPAGVTRMPLWRFGLLTGAGSLIWNTIFVLAGYLLGESWHIVEQYVDIVQYVVIAAVAAAVVWFVVVRTRALLAGKRDRDGVSRVSEAGDGGTEDGDRGDDDRGDDDREPATRSAR